MCIRDRTYLSPASGVQSAIDLSICDPSLYLDFSWKTLSDLCGSDHFPIEITCDVTSLCQTNSSWKLTKVDWNAFSNKANSQLSIKSILDTDNPIGTFTNMLMDVANETIPKSKLRVWYNDECKNARKECKKALNLIKRQPTRSNLEHYRIIRAKTRLIMKSTKRQSWQSFISKINNRTPLKKVWSMIRKISGKQSAQKINHLYVNGAEVTDVSDIVNTLGDTFSDNSSSDYCSTSFKSYKQNAEKYSFSFSSSNTETYNNTFSMDELTNTISKSHDTAVGPNSIHYQMLKNLPDSAMDTLLSAVNLSLIHI